MIIKKNKAFLLIEVLMTVLIVSGSIIFINHAFTSSLKATALSNDYINGVLLMEDKLFDIQLHSFAEEDTILRGKEESGGKTFYWEQVTSPLQEEATEDEYAKEDISLQVFKFLLKWKRRNVERGIDILTYTHISEIE